MRPAAATTLAALTTLAVLAAAPAAHAQSGGVPAERPQDGAGGRSHDTGGTRVGERPPRSERPRRRRPRARRGRAPLLSSFSASPARFFAYGRGARVRFRIDSRERALRVALVVRRPGERRPLRRIDLGRRPTRSEQVASLSGLEGGPLPQGALELVLSARDSAGRRLRARARTSARQPVSFYWHRFPLAGSFDYGGEGARFGAGRPGHSHQGQDLTAPQGTPVLAPRGGVVQVVAYQAAGAGHYVILDGAGEDRDYAFMHLETGSIPVRQGQRVATGQLLGRVGSTGASSGPHLHFEIWEGGGWYEGGRPVDPLPYLRRWDGWS